MNTHRRKLAHLRSVNRFFAAVGTIAAGEYLWVGRLHLIIDDDAAFFIRLDAANIGENDAIFCWRWL